MTSAGATEDGVHASAANAALDSEPDVSAPIEAVPVIGKELNTVRPLGNLGGEVNCQFTWRAKMCEAIPFGSRIGLRGISGAGNRKGGAVRGDGLGANSQRVIW